MNVDSILSDFRRDGVVILENAISSDTIEAFQMQVASEVNAPLPSSESGAANRVNLSDLNTWPQGSARRVVEVVPAAIGSHWEALVASPKLKAALNALLGVDAWELPFNVFGRGKVNARHWYCPVVFPEKFGLSRDSGKSATYETPNVPFEHAVRMRQPALGSPGRYKRPFTSKNACAISRDENPYGGEWRLLARHPNAALTHMPPLESAKLIDVLRASNCKTPKHMSQPATISWETVNRRRVRGKGWHIDVGSSFKSVWARKLIGHRDQGVIVLVLLSDCSPGGGGTAFVRGSHKWVAEKIASHQLHDICHLQLNFWASATVTNATASGRVRRDFTGGRNENFTGNLGIIQQVVGEAGTIVLAHPWLVHAGTTNLLHIPRMMVNGMARIKETAHIETSRESLGNLASTSTTQRPFMLCSLFKLQAPDEFCDDDDDDDDDEETSYLDASGSFSEFSTAHQQTWFLPFQHKERDVLTTSSSFPTVSIIVPVHNSILWIHECLASALSQSYEGAIELSLYDDASTDGSDVAICAWGNILRECGVHVVASGALWKQRANPALPHYVWPPEDQSQGAGGIGHSKNQAVKQSFGKFLVFLDSDDIMLTRRVEAQIELLMKNPGAIVGGCWRRHPSGSTCHYEQWANGLGAEQIWLEQFREVTVQMPTWSMSRSVFETVGGFVESPPADGEVRTLLGDHDEYYCS